jgi:lysophospholipase L1-like esterase
MNRRRCWLIALLATLALLVGPLPAYAAPRTLVAIGDSYGSGVGSFLYYDDDTDCYRSPFAYPSQLAAATGLSLTLAACSGATTEDVLRDQVRLVSEGTDYVTITVGGNDVGFRSVIRECALPGWLGSCSATIDAGLDVLRTELPDRLSNVYTAVRENAPEATVVVTGYPLMFNGSDCNPLTFFTRSEMKRINAGTEELNDAIRLKADAAGFRFVPAMPAFDGHAWCDPQPWINGLTFPVVNSFHPNIAGHTAYAVLVGRALFGSPVARHDARRPLDAASVSLPMVASAQGPTRIRMPDLNRAEVTRAAARAGVSKAELQRLRAAQRRGASNAELDRLDAKITAAAAQRGTER